MIKRYTRDEMGQVWSEENKFESMKTVEICVAEAQAELGIIPAKAAKDIRKKAKFDILEIEKIEAVTKHDVIAFVSNMAEYVGPNGRYIHYGMTSSDVIDTALSVRIQQGGKLLLKEVALLEKALLKQIKKHRATLCSGRTHGMHAEPTTFGVKLCGFLAEVRRNKERLSQALIGCSIAKLSGAVGTYSTQGPRVESKVARKLKLKCEEIATQVIPRDRHAELLNAIAMMGGGLERLSVELRHLQRTEVGEVIEGFTPGQKGSSAMPHKKNPISGENLTGVARMLRSFASAGLENIALWHERDISHSSVERVFFPDAFILLDYALNRMTRVIGNLFVDKKRMLKNMQISGGQLFSSHLLLSLVRSGLSREDAYKIVQKMSHELKPGEHLRGKCLETEGVISRVKKSEIDFIFSGKSHLKSIDKLIDRFVGRK